MALKIMADNGVEISAKQDGALYNVALNDQDFIIKGIGDEFSMSNVGLVVSVESGEAIMHGRHITAESTNAITLPQNESGYLVLRIDLTQPVGNEALLYATPTLTHEEINWTGTIYDMPIATFTTGTIDIESFEDVRVIKDNPYGEIEEEISELKNDIVNLKSKDIDLTRRTRRNITNDLGNLPRAISERNLEKYGYAIGDYFDGPSGYTYSLGDPDTYYGAYNNNAVVNTPHCGIVVDTKSSCQWQASGNAPRYEQSTIHSYLTNTVLPKVQSDLTALFGDYSSHLIANNMLANGIGTWDWTGNNYIRLLTEVQVYSSKIWSADNYQQGEAVKPLEIFQKFRFNEIIGNTWFWLRSLYSASYACYANNGGFAADAGVSDSGRVVGLILFK